MIRKLIIPILVTLLSSCTEFELDDLVLNLKPIGNHVAFANSSGGTITPISLNRSESSTASALRIENATGSLSSITVSYTFSGTAVFGQDFTVTSPGGTVNASGGTIKIVATNKKSTVADFAFVNLSIDPITDGIKDGAKTLIITLTNAVNEKGEIFDLGRGLDGQTIYHKSATINISDED
ncbi:MAG: hypothetical protein ACK5WV_04450 [Chryseotalea sp.]